MSKKKKNVNQTEQEKDLTKTEGAVPEEEAEKTEETAEDLKTQAASEQDLSDETEKDSEAEEVQEESEEPAAETTDKAEKKEPKERKLKWAKGAKADAEAADRQDKALEEANNKLKEANDKYARLFAEFDNFRKRSEKEKSQRYDFGAKDMVERILPVIDNFERGLAAVPEDKSEDSFVTGMQLTYKQLLKTLEDAGVKPIEAVGQEFNPDFHNAVMHVDDPEAGDNVVVEEFQKGYMYKDHVVRYSMVKVAN